MGSNTPIPRWFPSSSASILIQRLSPAIGKESVGRHRKCPLAVLRLGPHGSAESSYFACSLLRSQHSPAPHRTPRDHPKASSLKHLLKQEAQRATSVQSPFRRRSRRTKNP